MAVDLGLEINTAVTPSLHAQNIADIDEFDDDTSGHLQQAIDAFSYAYKAVGSTHAAREAVKTDPTLTPEAQVLRTADHADKMFKVAAAQLDKVRSNMLTGIKLIESEFAAPVQARAAHTLSVEIRSFVRGLKEAGKSPMDFVRKAIEAGDVDTVSAALGAPAYLTGLEPAMQAVLLRMWHEKQNPLSAKRARAYQKVVDLIHNNAPLLHKEMEKAVGMEPWKVAKLREAKARSDRAFAS